MVPSVGFRLIFLVDLEPDPHGATPTKTISSCPGQFLKFPTAMQLGFNLWAWTWCNISRPRKSGTLGGGTGGTCGARCPGTFAFLEPKEFLEPVELHRFQTGSTTLWFPTFHTGSLGSTIYWFHRFQTGSLGSTAELWELWRV